MFAKNKSYLTIVRAVAAESGRLPSDPRWRWTGTSDVQLQDGMVPFPAPLPTYDTTVG